jgi:uncharacterized membrane protein YczE
VLHAAVGTLTGWGLGGGIVATQAALLVLWWPFRIRPGVGTVAGVVLPGATCGVVLAVLPAPEGIAVRILALVLGGGVLAVGVALYLGAGLGSIPRDGLILALHQRRGVGLSIVRVAADLVCLAAGWLMLGPAAALRDGVVGVGSVVLAVGLGPAIAALLPLTRFPTPSEQHRHARDGIDQETCAGKQISDDDTRGQPCADIDHENTATEPPGGSVHDG